MGEKKYVAIIVEMYYTFALYNALSSCIKIEEEILIVREQSKTIYSSSS
jgi:hypothetical protein